MFPQKPVEVPVILQSRGRHKPCSNKLGRVPSSPRGHTKSSRHSSPHGLRGGFSHCAGKEKRWLPRTSATPSHGSSKNLREGLPRTPPSTKGGNSLDTSSNALAMSATLASLLQTGRRATGSPSRACTPRTPPPSLRGGKATCVRQGLGGPGRRPAHGREPLP